MKKKITKITNEYTNDEKGFVIKHVETIEEYEVEVPDNTGGTAKTTTSIADAVSKSVEDAMRGTKKAVGVPRDPYNKPYTISYGPTCCICTGSATVDSGAKYEVKNSEGEGLFKVDSNGDATIKGTLSADADTNVITNNFTINTANKSVKDIVAEISNILDKELKRSPF